MWHGSNAYLLPPERLLRDCIRTRTGTRSFPVQCHNKYCPDNSPVGVSQARQADSEYNSRVVERRWRSIGGIDSEKLASGERKILTALAQYPEGRSKVQVAVLTGYAVSGGGFNNYVGGLRSRGFIAGGGEQLRH